MKRKTKRKTSGQQGPPAALAKKILRAIRHGADLSLAVRHAGLDASTVAGWLREEGPAWDRFRDRVRRALSDPEMAALRSALRGARKDPRIALDYLAKRYRNKYDAPPQAVGVQFNFAEAARLAFGDVEPARPVQDRRPAEIAEQADATDEPRAAIGAGAGGETAAPGEEPAP
jgi:hypothetical protein